VVNPIFLIVEYCFVLQYFILDVVDFTSATWIHRFVPDQPVQSYLLKALTLSAM